MLFLHVFFQKNKIYKKTRQGERGRNYTFITVFNEIL